MTCKHNHTRLMSHKHTQHTHIFLNAFPMSKTGKIIWNLVLTLPIQRSFCLSDPLLINYINRQSPPISYNCIEFDPIFYSYGQMDSSLSAIRVESSTYLRLLIFLPAILIPGCDSSRSAFCMMYSAYKSNKQDDNLQPSQFWMSLLYHIRF